MQRKLAVACAVAGLILCVGLVVTAVSTNRSNVSARSIDKRLKVYDVRYFTGTNFFDYSYMSPGMRIKYEWQQLLRKCTSWRGRTIMPLYSTDKGPALLICGAIAATNTPILLLFNDKGDVLNTVSSPTRINWRTEYRDNLFVWYYSLFDIRNPTVVSQLAIGTYHLRCFGETNDLAIIRIR